jgi:hypothetical protein
MPEANVAILNLDDKSPTELEARRREIIVMMSTSYKGYADPDIPMELLQELAVVTSYLRRKNAGPPKVPRKAAIAKSPATLDDLFT